MRMHIRTELMGGTVILLFNKKAGPISVPLLFFLDV
jgi:hypothetical protein